MTGVTRRTVPANPSGTPEFTDHILMNDTDYVIDYYGKKV